MLRNQLKSLTTWTFYGLLTAFGGTLSCTLQPANEQAKPLQKKIVSLHPAITESIYALEKQNLLAGRSDYCKVPKATESLTPLGTSLTPNFEAIARIQPTLVLTDRAAGTPIKQLEKIVTTRQLPWLTREDVRDSILELGSVVGAEDKAKKLSSRIYQALESKTSSTSPRMLVLMASSDVKKGQIWFIRHDSLHGAAIEAAGFNNAAPKNLKGPPQMSLEQLLRQDPQIILFLPAKAVSREEEQALVKSLDILPDLQAVRGNSIGVLNGNNLMGAGPNITALVSLIRAEGLSVLDSK